MENESDFVFFSYIPSGDKIVFMKKQKMQMSRIVRENRRIFSKDYTYIHFFYQEGKEIVFKIGQVFYNIQAIGDGTTHSKGALVLLGRKMIIKE